jgi:hypothetical protein
MPPFQPRPGHLALILPLSLSSATLGLSLFQFPLFYSFLRPQPNKSKISGTPLSHFWSALRGPAAVLVSTLTLTTALSAGLCVRWLRAHETLETGHVSNWYLYGAGLTIAHLGMGLLVKPSVDKMVATVQNGKTVREADVTAVNEREMGTWFFFNTVRTLFVDVPALWCFAEGVALSSWII